MNLAHAVMTSPRPMVAPLLGYPGARLTNTSLRSNLFDPERHAASILALAERYKPDILFPMMDLAVEAHAMGLDVRFPENESPSVESHPVHTVDDADAWEDVDILADVRLQSFLTTIRLLRAATSTPIGAYVIGPFTLTGLLMGASSAAVATLRSPELVRRLNRRAFEITLPYAEASLAAGADFIVLLEPTAVLLSPTAFRTFSGAVVRAMAEALPAPVVLHVCGNTTPLIPAMCETGVQGLSLDSAVDLAEIGAQVPRDIVLIGNIDPVAVMTRSTPDDVAAAVRALRRAMAPYPNFVLSTGCDLPLETPLANITAFMCEGRA